MIIFDSIVRLIPGVLNDLNSAMTDSFVDDLLDAPYFTRPNDCLLYTTDAADEG